MSREIWGHSECTCDGLRDILNVRVKALGTFLRVRAKAYGLFCRSVRAYLSSFRVSFTRTQDSCPEDVARTQKSGPRDVTRTCSLAPKTSRYSKLEVNPLIQMSRYLSAKSSRGISVFRRKREWLRPLRASRKKMAAILASSSLNSPN